MNYITSSIIGVCSYPFAIGLTEVTTTLGKKAGFVDSTLSDLYAKSAQNKKATKSIGEAVFTIAEELLFRSLIQGVLLDRAFSIVESYSPTLSLMAKVASSAAIFSLAHWKCAELESSPNYPQESLKKLRNFQLLQTAATGFTFGIAYEISGKESLAPMVSHLLWNLRAPS